MRKGMLKRILAGFMAFALTFMSVDAGCITAVAADLQDGMKTVNVTVGQSGAHGYIELGKTAELYVDSIWNESGLHIDKTTVVPESYSSVDKGYVTSIKNQNPWGTCWAFAACAAMESYALAHGLVDSADKVDFSEYALAYLTSTDNMFQSITGDYTSTTVANAAFSYGGNDEFVFKALSKWAGIYNEDLTYYENSVSSGTVTAYVPNEEDIEFVFVGQKYIDISQVDLVKAAIMEHGAVTTSYFDADRFRADSDGVYYYRYEYVDVYGDYVETEEDDAGTNHAVTLVGWDDSIAKENFAVTDSTGQTHTPQNDGAWLVKNSWGTWYGNEGYFWISYEDYGILSEYNDAVIYEIAPKSLYDNIFQHDGATPFYMSTPGSKFASVFTVTGEKQTLEAISFALSSAGTNYTVSIYDNSNGSTLDEGVLLTSTTGITTYTGYYTVPISEEVILEAGDVYSVVISFDDIVYMVGGYSQNFGPFETFSSDIEGQSYQYYYGWSDVTEVGHVENLCIKAFTSDMENDTTKVPENLDYNIKDYTQITVMWDEISYATGYEVEYALSTDVSNTTVKSVTDNSFVFEGELGKEYAFRVKALYENGSSAYCRGERIYVPIPNMPNFRVDDRYYGRMTLSWTPLTDLATGYVITYEVEGYEGEIQPITINDASKSSYVLDTSEYPVGAVVNFTVQTLYDTFSSSAKYDSTYYYVMDEPLDAVVKWYVTGTNGKAIVVKVNTDAQETLRYVILTDDLLDYVISGSLGENNENLWEVGVKLNAENVPYNEVSYLCIHDIDGMKGLQETPFLVGGEFVVPIFEVLKDVKLAEGVNTTTLKAVITNPMDNFDYRYQWYVCDTVDGTATAIEGATESTYEATVAATETKYYYCEVSCEYGTVTTYSTKNETGVRTSVSGYLTDVVISVTEDIADQTYTGQAIEPEIEVKADGIDLILDTDYKLEYVDNTDAGTATIKITFIGKYEVFGTKNLEFEIIPMALTEEDVVVEGIQEEVPFDPSVEIIGFDNVEIILDSVQLEEGIDYNIAYSNSGNVGTYTITFLGNYSGTIEGTFEITSVELDNDLIVFGEEDEDGYIIPLVDENGDPITKFTYTYSGNPIIPVVDIICGELDSGEDGALEFDIIFADDADHTNVGTVEFTVVLKGNYSGEITGTLEILPKSSDELDVGSVRTNIPYTGEKIIPTITIWHKDDFNKTLVKDVDFVVSIAEDSVSDGIEVGTVKLCISFIGNYEGEDIYKEFEIVPAEPDEPEDITSDDVDINEQTGYISKITAGATVKDFLEMLDENVSVKVLDKNNLVVSNTALLGTGMKVCVMNGTEIVKTYIVIVTGDTNGDGKISITDMIAVKAHLLKKELLTGASEKAADVAGSTDGGDGKVSITDFIKVKAHLLKKETVIGVVVK